LIEVSSISFLLDIPPKIDHDTVEVGSVLLVHFAPASPLPFDDRNCRTTWWKVIQGQPVHQLAPHLASIGAILACRCFRGGVTQLTQRVIRPTPFLEIVRRQDLPV
jgi:hypothetical protein